MQLSYVVEPLDLCSGNNRSIKAYRSSIEREVSRQLALRIWRVALASRLVAGLWPYRRVCGRVEVVGGRILERQRGQLGVSGWWFRQNALGGLD